MERDSYNRRRGNEHIDQGRRKLAGDIAWIAVGLPLGAGLAYEGFNYFGHTQNNTEPKFTKKTDDQKDKKTATPEAPQGIKYIKPPTEAVENSIAIPYGDSRVGPEVDFGVPQDYLSTGDPSQGYGMPGLMVPPDFIAIHTTQASDIHNTAKEVRDFFETDRQTAASQFAVGVNGDMIQMGPFTQKLVSQAWGVKHYWYGIHIEMVCQTVYNSRGDMPPKQFESVVNLIVKLSRQYNIPIGPHPSSWRAPNSSFQKNTPEGVYGHRQLDPEHKTDPGNVLRDIRIEAANRLHVPSYEN